MAATRRIATGIRTRLIMAIMLVTLSVSLVGLLINIQQDIAQSRQAVVENNLTRLQALKIDFIKVIIGYTPDFAADLVDRLRSFPDIQNVVLRDTDMGLVFRYDSRFADPVEFPDIIKTGQSSVITYGGDFILLHNTVDYEGKHYGWVSVRVETESVSDQYKAYALTAALLMFGAALIALVLAILAGHYFSLPIRKLAAFIRVISLDHDYSQRLMTGQKGEVGDLYDGVNTLLDEIEASGREVERLNESRINNIIESALEGVISFNEAGYITYWSKQAEATFGWNEKEVLGHFLADVVMPERIRQQCHDDIQQFLNSGVEGMQRRRMPGLGLHREGFEIPLEISITAIQEDDGWNFNVFIRDISEQRKTEQRVLDMQEKLLRKERLAMVGQLTATVAHELRNPMGTIQNTLYLLSQKITGDENGIHALVERIERNVKRCDSIVSELLEFTSDSNLSLVPTVIDSWLSRLLKGYDFPEGLQVVTKLVTGTRVPVDIFTLESAVLNVINNAVQAAAEQHPGGGKIEVGTEVDSGRLGIVITDNGPGVAAEDRERVFEALYSTKVYGFGLGLPRVRKVLEKHGGEVCLDTGSTGGARVILWLIINNQAVLDEAH